MRKRSVGRLLGAGVVLPLFLLLLLLAACGSSNENTSAESATAAPTAVPTETRAPMATVAAEGASGSADAALASSAITEAALNAPVPGPIAGSEIYTGLTALHRPDRITYPINPPVGGDHNPAWMNCGVYTTPVPSELAVHSLEHGAVWITHLPTLPAEQIDMLKKVTKEGEFRLLSPDPEQDSPVIATAWGVQLKLQSADDPRLQEFITKYENRTDGPEYGAPCSGAYGEPEK